MSRKWTDVVVAALAGPLAAAGTAKVTTAPEELDWPIDEGVLATPHGPRIVGGSELAMATAATVLRGRVGAGVMTLGYTALAVTAWRLRGAKCACFGRARLASVGRSHVAGNIAGAAAGAGALVAGPGGSRGVRVAVGLAATAATAGLVALADRRADSSSQTRPAALPEDVHAVRLYTTASCPACRSLRHLVDTLEPARRDAVELVVLGSGEELPESMGGVGVPAAVGLDRAGNPTGEVVSGISSVKNLIDSITVTAPSAQPAPVEQSGASRAG